MIAAAPAEARGGLLAPQAGRLAPGAGFAVLDETRRLVEPGDDLYRLVWELAYHDGRIVRQYERRGDALLQVLFGRIDHKGIREIRVIDARSGAHVVDVGLPEGAEADVLYEVTMTQKPEGGFDRTRVYTFGWRIPGGAALYLHFDPHREPMGFWRDAKRSA
jgi:hypothetical protein